MAHRSFLDQGESAALEEAIAGLEAQTGVQLAAAVIGKADSYVELPWKAFALGLFATRGRNGILLLVSLFERKVEILPDVGLHVVGLPVVGVMTPGVGWFLYVFLIPFWAMFPIIVVGAARAAGNFMRIRRAGELSAFGATGHCTRQGNMQRCHRRISLAPGKFPPPP